jgi:hypothetical protein
LIDDGAIPAGTTGPPDFIGVGTQRSGTTWWFRTILQHPHVRAPHSGIKELHFFRRFGAEQMGRNDVERYHEKFPRLEGEIAGEWTPRYMHDVWTPRLIRRAAPDAKLIAMFRDPIERLRSGIPKEFDRDPNQLLEDVTADAIERGRYATQLEYLRDQHPDAELLVIQYEKCVADPEAQYRRTLHYLGVDPDGAPLPDFTTRRGKSQASNKQELWPDLRASIVDVLEEEVAELAAMEDEVDLSLWKNFAHLAEEAGHVVRP